MNQDCRVLLKNNYFSYSEIRCRFRLQLNPHDFGRIRLRNLVLDTSRHQRKIKKEEKLDTNNNELKLINKTLNTIQQNLLKLEKSIVIKRKVSEGFKQ